MEQSLAIITQTFYKWGDGILAFLPNILMSIIVLVLCYFLSRTVRRAILRLVTEIFPHVDKEFRLIEMAITLGFWIMSAILILNILNLATVVTHVLAGAGIVGIIAGFAFKDVASNAFAGLLVRSQHPFTIGDWVKVDEHIGVVESIGMVGTAIRTFEGQLAYVPNQQFFNDSFLNYSAYGKARVIVDVGVSYGDDLEHVEAVALDTVRALPDILLDEPVDFYVTGIGSSTYNCEVRFWVAFTERINYLKAKSQAIMAIKKAFESADISVAYNVMTLDFGGKGGVNLDETSLAVQVKDVQQALNRQGSDGI